MFLIMMLLSLPDVAVAPSTNPQGPPNTSPGVVLFLEQEGMMMQLFLLIAAFSGSDALVSMMIGSKKREKDESSSYNIFTTLLSTILLLFLLVLSLCYDRFCSFILLIICQSGLKVA